jgi:uracil-DNA glycosylase
MNKGLTGYWIEFFNGKEKEINEIISKIDFENKIIYPVKDNIFNAYKLTPYENIKVVIIGQDPYHNEGQAQGLAFSVPNEFKLPPSLRNIYTELSSDLNISNVNGNLEDWAKQGVFLINTILTVEKNTPLAHSKIGWDKFVLDSIKEINKKNNIIFLLWGGEAKKFKKYISDKNFIIESAHPSPLSCYRGFWGSKPFSKINDILKENKIKLIDWKIN